MKSVIIRQNGKVVLRVKQTKKGAEAILAADLIGRPEITVVMDDNSRIKL